VTTTNAWYLRCGRQDVAERAVLVGDRGRVAIAAELMQDVHVLGEDRGLTTATGTYRGTRLTVSAFGMGAPIAAVVMHELADLGVREFLRLGTVMTVGDTRLGELVVAHGAVRGESTSASYLPLEFPAVPDLPLTARVEAAARAGSRPVRTGIYGTFDGFYTQMTDSEPAVTSVRRGRDDLARQGVVATDMETSALFVVARALGVAAASLCLASVDGADQRRMEGTDRTDAEADLLRVGFDALAA
jgi:uridine phosphorylase